MPVSSYCFKAASYFQMRQRHLLIASSSAGIERVLRMVQAILMVVLSQPPLTGGFFKLVDLGNHHVWTEPRVASIATLTDLRTQVALIRRFFRMFRFLESFHGAYKIYTSFYAPPPPPPPPGPVQAAETSKGEVPNHQAAGVRTAANKPSNRTQNPPTEAWLDIFSRMFNGMYLLLEVLTLMDALRLPGLSVFGVYWSTVMHIEGQRFWLFALICGFASGLVKIVKLLAYAPVPQTGEGYGTGEKGATSDGMADWERERARLRRVVAARKESRRIWRTQLKTTGRGLMMRCVADLLDVVVPGSVVGWVDVQPGTVGAVMVVTTWLTGLGIWERCGREIGKA